MAWPKDLSPQTPDKGPPLPSFLRLAWPWIKNPGNPVANPAIYDTALDAEIEEMTVVPNEETPNPPKEIPASSESEDDFVLVLRKKPANPLWLKEHQKKLGEASKEAVSRTKHLKGTTRVQAMNRIIGEILKK